MKDSKAGQLPKRLEKILSAAPGVIHKVKYQDKMFLGFSPVNGGERHRYVFAHVKAHRNPQYQATEIRSRLLDVQDYCKEYGLVPPINLDDYNL